MGVCNEAYASAEGPRTTSEEDSGQSFMRSRYAQRANEAGHAVRLLHITVPYIALSGDVKQELGGGVLSFGPLIHRQDLPCDPLMRPLLGPDPEVSDEPAEGAH